MATSSAAAVRAVGYKQRGGGVVPQRTMNDNLEQLLQLVAALWRTGGKFGEGAARTKTQHTTVRT